VSSSNLNRESVEVLALGAGMDTGEIEAVMRRSVGDPDCGAIADAIPVMAAAVAAALDPAKNEIRILQADETR